VDITTLNNLGAVTVSVKALDEGEFCTAANATSAAYAARCFGIEVSKQAVSTVRLWTLSSEMDGVTRPGVFRYVSPNWLELTANANAGTQGVYSYAEAQTPSFSHFLIADSGTGPTAVKLREISTTSGQSPWVPLLAFIFALCTGLAVLGGRRKPIHISQQTHYK